MMSFILIAIYPSPNNEWEVVWEGFGFPPPILENGFKVNGAHLPIKIKFKYDVTQQLAIHHDSKRECIHPQIENWYIEKVFSEYFPRQKQGIFSFVIRTDGSGRIELLQKKCTAKKNGIP